MDFDKLMDQYAASINRLENGTSVNSGDTPKSNVEKVNEANAFTMRLTDSDTKPKLEVLMDETFKYLEKLASMIRERLEKNIKPSQSELEKFRKIKQLCIMFVKWN